MVESTNGNGNCKNGSSHQRNLDIHDYILAE